MTASLIAFIRRIPWRLLAAVLGGVLVIEGGSRLLSVELPAGSSETLRLAKQGTGMVVIGGVVLIAVIVSR